MANGSLSASIPFAKDNQQIQIAVGPCISPCFRAKDKDVFYNVWELFC